jgi:hypothetical protein
MEALWYKYGENRRDKNLTLEYYIGIWSATLIITFSTIQYLLSYRTVHRRQLTVRDKTMVGLGSRT